MLNTFLRDQEASYGRLVYQILGPWMMKVWIHFTQRVSAFLHKAHKCIHMKALFHSFNFLNPKPHSLFEHLLSMYMRRRDSFSEEVLGLFGFDWDTSRLMKKQ